MSNTRDIVSIINHDIEIFEKIINDDIYHMQYTAALGKLRSLQIKDEKTYLKYVDTVEEFKNLSYFEITTYDRFSDNEYFKIIDTMYKNKANVKESKKM